MPLLGPDRAAASGDWAAAGLTMIIDDALV
jgi:hypothetical protein